MKCELLAPAGTMECLVAAVQNGTDAIYLGGSRFGARAFAGNFNEEEIVDYLNYVGLNKDLCNSDIEIINQAIKYSNELMFSIAWRASASLIL